jgi:hypothetical protein
VIARRRTIRGAKFGAAVSFAERGRKARGLRAFDSLCFSMLDPRLGGRMLVKHPAHAVMATITVAIRDRRRRCRVRDRATSDLARDSASGWQRDRCIAELECRRQCVVPESRRDYELWRDGLRTITDLSTIEVEERSIAVGAGTGQPETIASVTASIFALTCVPALVGPTLLQADQRGDAEEVVVAGYDFWKNKLDGAADGVGRVTCISGTPIMIVGVMPRGYGCPQRNGVSRPLHLERISEASPSLSYIFGRLAPGHPRDERPPRWRR